MCGKYPMKDDTVPAIAVSCHSCYGIDVLLVFWEYRLHKASWYSDYDILRTLDEKSWA